MEMHKENLIMNNCPKYQENLPSCSGIFTEPNTVIPWYFPDIFEAG
jgi:hypothetical protein